MAYTTLRESIPDEMASLTNLITLEAENTLVKKLPESFLYLKGLNNLLLSHNEHMHLNFDKESEITSLRLVGPKWMKSKAKNENCSFKDIEDYLGNYWIFKEHGLAKWNAVFDSCDTDKKGYLDYKGLQKFNAHLIVLGNPCQSIPASLFQLRFLKILDMKRQALKDDTNTQVFCNG